MYPVPAVVTVAAEIAPEEIVTEQTPLEPSPRIGTFVTTRSAVIAQAFPPPSPTPAVVTLTLNNAPSAKLFPDSGVIDTGTKSGVIKF